MLQNNCLQIPTQKAEIIENCIALVLQWHFDSVKHQTYDTVNIHITYVCVCVCVCARTDAHIQMYRIHLQIIDTRRSSY